jgi:hypothetical protein
VQSWSGVADHVTAPEKMPEILLRYARHPYMADPDGLAAEASEAQQILDPVFALLLARSGHDFRNYKRSTLRRRIHHRMGLANRGTTFVGEGRPVFPNSPPSETFNWLIIDISCWMTVEQQLSPCFAPTLHQREEVV